MSATYREDDPDQSQVDVLLISWNRVDDTIAAIDSCLAQRGVRFRVLIVDQGSEPQNLARLETHVAGRPEVILQKCGRNTGAAGGRNIAARLGNAPYLVSLDSDAEFADDQCLARIFAVMESRPDLCAVAFRITNYFTRRNDDSSWDYPGAHTPDECFATTRFIGAGHCIRRDTFELVGGFDERLFFLGEELDLAYRLLNTGLRIEYRPDIEVLHKVSPEHRVFWANGRYFLSVRNGMFSHYKFGVPLGKLTVAAVSLFLRGARNGLAWDAARAIWAAIQLSGEFRRSTEDKRWYRLSPETWQYILECEPSRRDSFWAKCRRPFAKLPFQRPAAT